MFGLKVLSPLGLIFDNIVLPGIIFASLNLYFNDIQTSAFLTLIALTIIQFSRLIMRFFKVAFSLVTLNFIAFLKNSIRIIFSIVFVIIYWLLYFSVYGSNISNLGL